MQPKMFYHTRKRLAFGYSAIVALILGIGGFGIYRLIVYLSWTQLEQEMASLTAPLQKTIEDSLQQPGQLDVSIHQHLPGICVPMSPCESLVQPQQFVRTDPQLVNRITQGQYCLRLLNQQGQAIALIRLPAAQVPPCTDAQFWQARTIANGTDNHVYYHQVLRPLYTPNDQPWGTLEVVRSSHNLDISLFATELTLGIGIPFTILLISFTSWWLAKFAMQPVQQSYQQMQQFTADAAHELRTPLAALRAMVQTALRAEELSVEEARETMEIIDRQSQRLSHLVQELLLLSRLDHQTKPSGLRSCCLNQIVEALVKEVSALAQTSQVELVVHEQRLKLEVLGDAEQIHRAILNLVTNAIQYTPANGLVTVRLFQHQSYGYVQVQDTGIGIAIADQKRIFNRFYRANQQVKGTGLGLAIVAAIAQVHRGDVQVESTEGKGSTFTLRIPLFRENQGKLK